MAEPRFLIVRLGSLGDIVHTFPAVAGLRKSFPQAEIVWITHPRWEFLVESSGLASQLKTVDTRSLASLREAVEFIRARNWNAAIDYQGLWKSAGIPFLGGVKRRIGFSWAAIREYGVPVLYTERVQTASRHVADQNGELSAQAGARQHVASVTLRVRDTDASQVRSVLEQHAIERYVVLSPGGGWRSKCWPAERYGALSRMIYDNLNMRCVVNYGPCEKNLADEISRTSDGAQPLSYNGNLGELMALLKNAACLIGGDTGPLHLGVALGTPTVALFGPTDPARNGPYASNDTVLRSSLAVTSYKRCDQPDASLLQIGVDEVLQAIRERILREN
ncbi:MAG: lipopolysaccharide heptosyltransferase I [Candidatus Acidiferrum sp.]